MEILAEILPRRLMILACRPSFRNANIKIARATQEVV